MAEQELSPAEKAVKYMLDRIQRSRKLQNLMYGTHAFHLLCVAEAAWMGVDADAVEGLRSVDLSGEKTPTAGE